MKTTATYSTTAALLLSVVSAGPTRFNVRDASNVASNYDYIVVGAGASGLTVANRLSENSKYTVLVIEAGQLDHQEDFIWVPGMAGSGTGTVYDWNSTYVANPALNGRVVPVAQGRGPGGGTLINRLLMDRGSLSDYSRFLSLGNVGWDFSGLLPYFMKSETYTPPTKDIAQAWNITYNPAYHGTSGPIQVTHSPFIWPTLKNYILGHRELGAKTPADANGGDAVGVYAITHCQDPKTNSRFSARRAYYDTALDRKNLQLLTNTQVTRLTSKGNTITGVEAATGPNAPKITITANKDVIMAAGALRTPHILKLSGVGDADELKKFNISVVADNKAVGQNLQDHVLLPTVFGITADLTTNLFTTNATFAANALTQWRKYGTGPYSTATADYLAFLPASLISPANWTSMALNIAAQDSNAYLDSSAPSSYRTGYAIQKTLQSKGYLSQDEAQIEIIWADGVALAGLMHPLSRGTIKLASTNPWDQPLADPAHLKNPVDLQLMVETVKYIRRLMATNSMKPLSPVEYVPGVAAASDAAIEAYIRGNAATVWHPVGSCAIGPQALGGAVDPTTMRPYGVKGVRVVDASTMPMLPASHVMSTVYAMAEKAADIIKATA